MSKVSKVEVSLGKRSGRVWLFNPSQEELCRLREMPTDPTFDEQDAAREKLLRRHFERANGGFVEATAHPGIENMCQVFVSTGEPVFACTVVSEDRLGVMLADAGVVVEGFSLQAAPSQYLTNESIRAAVEAWAKRNFPDISPQPRIVLKTDPLPGA